MSYKGHTGWIFDFIVTENHIYSASMDSTIRKFDIESGEVVKTFNDHSECVCRIKLTSTSLISCSWDGTVRVF